MLHFKEKVINPILIFTLLMFGWVSLSNASALSEIELLDCYSCSSDLDARNAAKSLVQFRAAGEYPVLVFNTATNLTAQFRVVLERESGRTSTIVHTETVNAVLQGSFDSWVARHGMTASKDIVIDIICPNGEPRCGTSGIALGSNARWEDVQGFARGHIKVRDELNGLPGLFTLKKIESGKVKLIVNVEFEGDGVTFKLQMVVGIGTVTFKLIEATDSNGLPLTISGVSTVNEQPSSPSSVSGNTIYVSGGGSGGNTWINVKVCINGVCSSTQVHY
jgi:hypothetical protein